MSGTFVHVALRPGMRDVRGAGVRAQAQRALGQDPGPVASSRVYLLDAKAEPAALQRLAAHALADAVLEDVSVGALLGASGAAHILVGRKAGITDDEGQAAHDALADVHGPGLALGDVRSRVLYAFAQPVPLDLLERLALELLGNPLVDEVRYGPGMPAGASLVPAPPAGPAPALTAEPRVPLTGDDAALLALSKELALGFTLDELHAVRDHLRSDPVRTHTQPTRTEIGVFAQTWSEHCKHKEFNAEIRFRGEGGQVTTVRSLFKTFIQGSTEQIREVYAAAGTDFLVTVFKDNAGVVKLDDERLLVLKVETHNSPSALDPLGGAMTGVLGVNRDAFGTGKGGATLLFNTDVLCFGPPDYARPLLAGQLHPRRVFAGVREGVEQAGNQTGVPTVNGALVFDDRFAGKPLVFCGTAALMPVSYAGTASHLKELLPGDRVVMAGGRVGQDGLGGATFSSAELTNAATRSVVQIGSPITQKGLSDFVEEACALGLVSGCTDNGAGGLSSSVGELAQETGGASIDLSLVPLKVPGLQPWEIFLSESQERMTLAVRPAQLDAICALAKARHVELSDLGEFTSSGRLEVRHGQISVASLDLHFLHHGVPKKVMEAEWTPPDASEPALSKGGDLGADLLALLGSHNICSREKVVRQFDHEVKGRSVLKSYMGPRGKAPQDAAVLRVGLDASHNPDLGLAVSSGICPKYGDLDPYEMSAGAFDEALRSLISVGVPLPRPGSTTVISACDNFCVPDSAYDPVGNPDGKQKLGKLVRMCQALHDSATFFLVPMTSGKDSMKNDFRVGGVKISVPPTVLYTMVARMDDVTRAVSSEFKQAGDAVLRVGHTHDELGCSEHYRLRGELGANVPRVRPHDARRVYQKMTELHALGLLRSSHDLSDGGLAVALAECALGANLGARIDLPGGALTPHAELFSESHSRFVVTVSQANLAHALAVLGADGALIGEVTREPVLSVKRMLSLPVAQLAQAYEGGPV